MLPENLILGRVLLPKCLHADLVNDGLAVGVVLVVHDLKVAHPARIPNAVNDARQPHVPLGDG